MFREFFNRHIRWGGLSDVDIVDDDTEKLMAITRLSQAHTPVENSLFCIAPDLVPSAVIFSCILTALNPFHTAY